MWSTSPSAERYAVSTASARSPKLASSAWRTVSPSSSPSPRSSTVNSVISSLVVPIRVGTEPRPIAYRVDRPLREVRAVDDRHERKIQALAGRHDLAPARPGSPPSARVSSSATVSMPASAEHGASDGRRLRLPGGRTNRPRIARSPARRVPGRRAGRATCRRSCRRPTHRRSSPGPGRRRTRRCCRGPTRARAPGRGCRRCPNRRTRRRRSRRGAGSRTRRAGS